MRIREKTIGGQSVYEIVEEIHHATGIKYRVIAALGVEATPENAQRRRLATLRGLERSLQRLEPLRNADPGIERKCNSLTHRINRERQKLVQLTDAIEQMNAPEPGLGLDDSGKSNKLQLVLDVAAQTAEIERTD